MITGIQVLPTKYADGTVLDSAQTRRVISRSTDTSIEVGGRLIIPPHARKVIVTDTLGGVVIDRYFLSTSGHKGFPQSLTPVYLKVYEGDEANVILLLKGINRAYSECTGVDMDIYPLRKIMLELIEKEIKDEHAGIADVMHDYIQTCDLRYANDTVSGIATTTDSKFAGYPWDLCNFLTPELTAVFMEKEANYPARVVNDLNSLHLDIASNNSGLSSSVIYEIEEIFDPLTCKTFRNCGIDAFTNRCIELPEIPAQDLFKNLFRKGRQYYPIQQVNEDIKVEQIEVFSSEILKFCVWLHQLTFHEITFKTILPNRYRPESFRLLSAQARTFRGVDIGKMQRDLHSLLSFWDSNRYKELIVSKTSTDEVYMQLIGENNEDNRNMYFDLFFTTLLSQALVRTNLDLIN